MMYWGHNGMGGWGYAAMSVSTLLFWVFLIAAIVLLVRHLAGQVQGTPGGSARPGAAEQILAERFARGEIDDEEYRRRLATVRGQDHKV